MELIKKHLDFQLMENTNKRVYTIPFNVSPWATDCLYDHIPTIKEIEKQLNDTKTMFSQFYKFQSYEVINHNNGDIRVQIIGLFYGFKDAMNLIEKKINQQLHVLEGNQEKEIVDEIVIMEKYLDIAKKSNDLHSVKQLSEVAAMCIRILTNKIHLIKS